MSAPDFTDFLDARLAEDEARYPYACAGVGEYESCAENAERWLREVAAKRAILAEHEHRTATVTDGTGCVLERSSFCMACEPRKWAGPCPTLRALASAYSDHPDYQKAWA